MIVRHALIAGIMLAALAETAAADFRLCNNTGSRVGIAVGYKDNDGWTTEGWWNLSARTCETLLRGGLVARFYYIYAIDYDRGGEWAGRAYMCTRDKEFTIRGVEDCLARGLRAGWFLRSRYRRAALMDRAADRLHRPGPSATAGAVPALAPRADDRRPTDPGAARRVLATKPEPMRRLRRTKIVATLGPASSEQPVIDRLFAAGADVFRINMSHTSHERMRELIAAIRAVETDRGRPIGILVDLQGPKLRIGAFRTRRSRSRRARTSCSTPTPRPAPPRAFSSHIPEILASLEPGHTLLLDDGKIRLLALETAADHTRTRVEVGGRLTARKGVSLPDTTIPFSAMTPKDRSDLDAALDAGVDWIGLSFIQRPEDIAEAKKIARGRASVLAKIEKPQAVHRIDEIMDFTDLLMVARGDLGVELPLEKVPGIQKQLTRAARRAGKPVVVATQMLESMITSPVPTRAEVSDVATAVFEGADAVMLSAESAAGRIPGRGGRDDEPHHRGSGGRPDLPRHHPGAARRARGDRRRRHRGRVRGRSPRRSTCSAIVCWTFSGSTALRMARERPNPPIVAISPKPVDRAPTVARMGRALRGRAGRARPGGHGRPRVPHHASAEALPGRASASSSSPASRSARRAPPTWCASPSSAAKRRGTCSL